MINQKYLLNFLNLKIKNSSAWASILWISNYRFSGNIQQQQTLTRTTKKSCIIYVDLMAKTLILCDIFWSKCADIYSAKKQKKYIKSKRIVAKPQDCGLETEMATEIFKSQTWVKWIFMVKNPPASVGGGGDMGLIPGSGRSPGGGHGDSLEYSCLENPIFRGT